MPTSSVVKIKAHPKLIARYIKLAIMAAIVIVILNAYNTYQKLPLPTSNNQMAPTIKGGAVLLVNNRKRSAKDFSLREIAIYQVRTNDGVELRVGRVVALPGHSVRIEEKTYNDITTGIYINGEQIDVGAEIITGLKNIGTTLRQKNKTLVVPEGKMFLLNDNLYSEYADSRKFGPLGAEAVVGRLVTLMSNQGDM